MKRTYIKIAAAAILSAGLLSCESEKDDKNQMKLEYPETKKVDSVDVYFGHEIHDPYRWLEDDMSEETADWVERQNELTFDYLSTIPYREKLRERLTAIWDYEKLSAPFKRGDYTYFFKNDGLQDHSVLYRFKDKEDEPEVFIDPNTFSEDGTTSLAGVHFTKDGKLLAIQISEGGSDWRKVIVMDAGDGSVIEDTLVDVKFSDIAWKKNEGFYYSSYDKPENGSALSGKTQYHHLFYHRLGSPQEEDELIFGGEDTPRRYIQGNVTEDQSFLVIEAAVSTTGNELYVQDLRKEGSEIVPVVENFDHTYDVFHSKGDDIYVETDWKAPNKRVMLMNINEPSPENWKELIPESEKPLSAATGGGKIFVTYIKDAISQVVQFGLDGEREREIELPGKGTAGGFSGRIDEDEIYYTFSSYIRPSTIYKYTVSREETELYREPAVDFEPSDYEMEMVFYRSADSTKIPMIIAHKKGIELDGSNPTILYGYGGFNISLTPNFSLSALLWMEQGGVYAVANLRGGGEYGEDWHKAGTKLNKQNVFDDFIAAGEYLIEEKYTSSEKLGIMGGSNGGLLVGACMTQRPDLFAVALPAVGVLDMLRYHTFTAGAGWAYDYGTAEDSEEMFEYLYGYSPYHNLVDGTEYPATLITTADHDDRVVPAHSFKFAVRLQEAQAGEDPVLIRVETKAGHGAGKPTSMIIEEIVDKWAFALYNMGVEKL